MKKGRALIVNIDELQQFVSSSFSELQPETRVWLWRRFVRFLAQESDFHAPATLNEINSSQVQLSSDQQIVRVNCSDVLKERVNSVVQYISWAENTNEKPKQNSVDTFLEKAKSKSFAVLVALAAAWDEQQRKIKQTFADIENGDVLELANIGNYKFVKLITEKAFKREGEEGGNCMGREEIQMTDYFGESEAGNLIAISMRDSRNRSHAQIVIDTLERPMLIKEIVGKEHLSVIPEYAPYIRQFLSRYRGANMDELAEISAGFLTIDDHRYDLINGETLPEQCVNKLRITRSRWPIVFPNRFEFGAADQFNRAEVLRRSREWYRDFNQKFPDHILELPFYTMHIRDSINLTMPEHFTCHGHANFFRSEANSWPTKMYVAGSLFAEQTNIKMWRRRDLWRVDGIVNLRKSSLECFEEGTYLVHHIDISETPIKEFPRDFVANGNVIAKYTPHLRSINGRAVFNGDLDLTGSAVARIEEGAEIGGDLIISFTEHLTRLPPNLIVDIDLIAHSSKLTTIGANTSVGFVLDLTNSNVTHIPDDVYVGYGIHGPDGEYWATSQLDRGPASRDQCAQTIQQFNKHYENWPLSTPSVPKPSGALAQTLRLQGPAG